MSLHSKPLWSILLHLTSFCQWNRQDFYWKGCICIIQGLQRILWMELRYARPRTRRHGESPVGAWRRRFHDRLRGIASTAVKSPPPPSGFAMLPDTKSGLRRTRNFTKSTTRTVGRPLLIGNNYFETTSLCVRRATARRLKNAAQSRGEKEKLFWLFSISKLTGEK